jgi:3D (Asp-Asp-Asp) domain-containing protein
MMDVLIGIARTNTNEGSVTEIVVEDIICTITIIENEFGDLLPVIPKDSKVDKKRVLYRMRLLARLCGSGGTPVSAMSLRMVSDRACDHVVTSGTTDEKGEMCIELNSRFPGTLNLTTSTEGITSAAVEITLKEAWFEAPFKITGYNVCLEDDFDGDLCEANGLRDKHKSDFLFSVAGIPMQGTGKASNGRLIGLKTLDANWHRNAKGNRDYIADRRGVTFQYLAEYGGKWNSVKENHSVAVDPRKIPPLAKLLIEGVGERFADDTGSMIMGYHIDHFLGAGREVVSTWLKGGVNGTKRKVKFLGYEP